jgi:hypothetical protein
MSRFHGFLGPNFSPIPHDLFRGEKCRRQVRETSDWCWQHGFDRVFHGTERLGALSLPKRRCPGFDSPGAVARTCAMPRACHANDPARLVITQALGNLTPSYASKWRNLATHRQYCSSTCSDQALAELPGKRGPLPWRQDLCRRPPCLLPITRGLIRQARYDSTQPKSRTGPAREMVQRSEGRIPAHRTRPDCV